MTKLILFAISLLILSEPLKAQLNEKDQLLGPTIGLRTQPNEPTIGFNYESQLSQIGDVVLISLGGIFRYSKFDDNYPFDDYYEYEYVTFGVQSNLNFNRITDGKFVPFVGLVIGYNNISAKYVNRSGRIRESDYTSGAWLWAQGGMRYFFSPSVAGVFRIGAGNFNFNAIEFGVDFKL